MRGSKAGNLASVVRSAAKITLKASKKRKHSSSTSFKKNPSLAADDSILEKNVSVTTVSNSAGALLKSFNAPPSSTSPSLSLHAICTNSLDPGYSINKAGFVSSDKLSDHASNLLCPTFAADRLDLDSDDGNGDKNEKSVGGVLCMELMGNTSNTSTSPRRTEVMRERKQQSTFKNTQTVCTAKLVDMCGKNLGSDATIEMFGRLGQATGIKEYKVLLNICVDNAKLATDEDIALEHIYRAHKIFELAIGNGLRIREEIYEQLMLYLIDCSMVKEFFYFHNIIVHGNPDALPRLSYYEMLLWVKVKNEEKIQELCCSALDDSSVENSCLKESLLLALCNSDRRKEFLMLVNATDISKVTSSAYLVNIFRCLGKLSLEPIAEQFFLALKSSDIGAKNTSDFIWEYGISIPNLVIEDVVALCRALHSKMEVLPTAVQYEKLINHCCQFNKVYAALIILDWAFESGVSLSVEAFHTMLDACFESYEFNLVHQINSMICRHNVKPNYETFRLMILLSVRMKDFRGAYNLIDNMVKMGLEPEANIYNMIRRGYFSEGYRENEHGGGNLQNITFLVLSVRRYLQLYLDVLLHTRIRVQILLISGDNNFGFSPSHCSPKKNTEGAVYVLAQMENANVKPDALTFASLIYKSRRKEDILKFYNEMTSAGIQPTKQVFISLINAYASCGQFEKAKQVVLDARIPVRYIVEIKSALVGALASNGEFSNALSIYEDIKQSKCKLDGKAIRSFIEHFQSKGDLDQLLQLLEDFNDSPYWIDNCFKVISYCLQQQNLRCTIDLLKKLKVEFPDTEAKSDVMFDEVFSMLAEKEPTDMQFCLDLLQAIKEEFNVISSRKSLDFLLSACTSARDAKAAVLVWKEYEAAELPYNEFTRLRMYQALLASGDEKGAEEIRKEIPSDDSHFRWIIEACDKTFIESWKEEIGAVKILKEIQTSNPHVGRLIRACDKTIKKSGLTKNQLKGKEHIIKALKSLAGLQ